MTNTSETNSVERSILINASRDQVWRSISNAENFGAWFGVDFKSQRFIPGQSVRGLMDGNCGHDGLWLDFVVERIEPQDLFSYRWHPYAVEPGVDYSGEQPTLVTFTLKDAPDNSTLLTVVESGFDNVPAQRRLEAFRMHSKGWEAQLENIARHASK